MRSLEILANARVLVTGGCGFIGSRLTQRLVEQERAHVSVLDDLFTGSLSNLPEGCDFHQGSVTDAALVGRLVKDADYVFHVAARNIIVSTIDPRQDYESNIGGTLNVLLAARESDVRRVVYASSASVYGNARYLPITEDDRLDLLTPYAVSKFAGESYCLAFYERWNVPVSAVRYSNIYGPGQSVKNPYSGVVAKFFDRAMSGAALIVHGDGHQTRDFTYVDDAVEATLLAATEARAEGEVFNVATGIETSVNELAEVILTITAATGRKATHTDRRDIDNIRRRVLNVDKIRKFLHWAPSHTLEAGLRRTYEWSQQQAIGS